MKNKTVSFPITILSDVGELLREIEKGFIQIDEKYMIGSKQEQWLERIRHLRPRLEFIVSNIDTIQF